MEEELSETYVKISQIVIPRDQTSLFSEKILFVKPTIKNIIL